jgi:hypothetical protein
MFTTHKIGGITFDSNFMYLHASGKLFKISIDTVSSKLKAANEMQRNLYKISPSGYGIHWPLIDEDLSIDLLLKAAF